MATNIGQVGVQRVGGQQPAQAPVQPGVGRLGRHSLGTATAELRPPARDPGATLRPTVSLGDLKPLGNGHPGVLPLPPRVARALPAPPPPVVVAPPPLPPPPAPTLQASAAARAAMALPGPPFQDRERLVDGQALRTRLGHEPKKDAKLFGVVGPRVWGRSGTYKGVLKSLDRYQQAVQATTADRQGAGRATQVQTLDRLLAKAERSIDQRLAKKNEQPMLDLRAMVQRERGLLQGIANGKDLPASAAASFQTLLDLRHVGMPLTARDDLAQFNGGQVKDPPGRTVLGSGQVNTVFRVEYNGADAAPKAFKQVASQDTSPASMAGIAGIDRDAPAYAARNVAASLVNVALGLDVIPKTSFASHGQDLGIAMDLVQGGKAPSEASSQGLPLDAATHRKISAEQAKVDAGTKSPAAFKQEMALLGFKIDAGSGEWRSHPANSVSMDLTHPVLQNKLNDLEWHDIICGQIDRNNSNYLVTFDGNGQPNGVKGIDNDFSFGTKHPNPDNVAKSNLPRMIDGATADAIEQMGRDWHSAGGMKEQLTALLGPEAVQGVESRLFGKPGPGGFPGVLDHIQTLRTTNMVVPHGQWDAWAAPDGSSPHEVATAGNSKFASLTKQIEVENVNEAKERAKW